MAEKHFQESDLRIWVKNISRIWPANMGEKYVQECGPGSGSIKLFLLGGFQPPRPPGGGLAAPRAPLHTERLRLSGSPFFLGTKIIGPARTLATKISEFWPVRTLASKISEFWTYWNPCVKDFQISRRRRAHIMTWWSPMAKDRFPAPLDVKSSIKVSDSAIANSSRRFKILKSLTQGLGYTENL